MRKKKRRRKKNRKRQKNRRRKRKEGIGTVHLVERQINWRNL